ncbi:hypothetical protein N7522_000839, partial [Penicillium canescens]
RPVDFRILLVVAAFCASATRSCEDHPSTLTSMASLASTYTNQGRYEGLRISSMANLAFT